MAALRYADRLNWASFGRHIAESWPAVRCQIIRCPLRASLGQLTPFLEEFLLQRLAGGHQRKGASAQVDVGLEHLKHRTVGNRHQVDCKLQFHPAATEARVGAQSVRRIVGEEVLVA